MDVQVLRIGNFVIDSKKRFVTIQGIGSLLDEVWVNYANGAGIYREGADKIKPIPLTEEIITKVEKLNECIYYLIKNDDKIGGYAIFLKKDNFYLRTVYNLHTLQNFHFVLTGNELEITL